MAGMAQFFTVVAQLWRSFLNCASWCGAVLSGLLFEYERVQELSSPKKISFDRVQFGFIANASPVFFNDRVLVFENYLCFSLRQKKTVGSCQARRKRSAEPPCVSSAA
jgi:hypothetical protein